MTKKTVDNFLNSTSKIYEFGNQQLSIDGHAGFKITEIHFSNDLENRACRLVRDKKGNWVHICS